MRNHSLDFVFEKKLLPLKVANRVLIRRGALQLAFKPILKVRVLFFKRVNPSTYSHCKTSFFENIKGTYLLIVRFNFVKI